MLVSILLKQSRRSVTKAGCEVIFLPAYSPELNKIEQFWERLKKQVGKLNNKCESQCGRYQRSLQDIVLTLPYFPIYVRWYNSQGQIVQFVGEPPRTTVNPEPGLKTIVNKSGVSARQLTLPVMKGQILLGYLRVATSLQSFADLTMKLRLFLMVGVPLT